MLVLHKVLGPNVLIKVFQELVWLILNLLLYVLHDIKFLIVVFRCFFLLHHILINILPS